MARRIYLPLLALLLSPLTAAAQGGGERRIIPVSVIDREGKLVEGLTAADFRGEFRGKPVRVVSVEWVTGPRLISLSIDTSAGMGRPMAKTQLAWWAVGEAISKLPKTTSLALQTFDTKVKRYSGPTNDEVSTMQAYAEAQRRGPSGGTVLFEGIWEAGRVLLLSVVGDVVFVFTDGEDIYSIKTREEVCSAFAHKGIRVYFFLISGRAGRDREEVQSAAGTIADATGGRVFEIFRGRQNTAEISTRLEPFLASMTRFYRVEIELPIAIDKEREWKLEVVGGQSETRRDVDIAYPRLLVPLNTKAGSK